MTPMTGARKNLTFFTIIALTYVLLILVVSFAWSTYSNTTDLAMVDEHLAMAARNIKYLLPADYHDRATHKNSISYTEEIALRNKINGFIRNTNIASAYTVVKTQDNTFHFSSTTVSPKEALERQSWYFLPYNDIPAPLKKAYETKTPTSATFKNQWNESRTFCTPEKSPSGITYLSCADVDLKYIQDLKKRNFFIAMSISAFFTLLLIPIVLLTRHIYRKFNQNIQKSQEELIQHQKFLEQKVSKRTFELEKEKHNAEQQAEIKTRFLANMSHEIRTPLNAIIGSSELLSDSSLDKDQEKLLRTLLNSSETLLNLVNNILDMSKIEADEFDVIHTPFTFQSKFIKMENVFAAQFQQKKLSLKFTIDENIPPRLLGDPVRLQQIFINLIGNALKFTNQGGVVVSCTLVERKQNKAYCRCSVQDSGPGIPEDKLHTIFNPYTQVERNNRSQSFGSTGLGLNICKKIVDKWGGEFTVKSTVGNGSCFSFTLPFEIPEIASARTNNIKTISHAEHGYAGPPLTFLIVEDYQPNREILSKYLEPYANRVDEAFNGLEACALIRRNLYDVIFMDLEMPVMDGFTAFEKIKEIEKNLNQKPTPIFALTAHALKGFKNKAEQMGFVGYLTKPLARSHLYSELNHLFPDTVAHDVADADYELNMRTALAAMIPQYLELVRQELTELEQHIQVNNTTGIAKIAHKLKGSGSSYGFNAISKHAKEMELAAKNNDMASVRQAQANLTTFFRGVQATHPTNNT